DALPIYGSRGGDAARPAVDHLATRDVAAERLPVGADLPRGRAQVHDFHLGNAALERIAGDGATDDGEEIAEPAGGGELEFLAGQAVLEAHVIVQHGRVDAQPGEGRQLALAVE